jgi:hypothetical protein
VASYFFPKSLRISENHSFENHGAAILLLVRERRATTWTALCRALKFDPDENHSGHFGLRSTLRELVAAGLLESKSGIEGPYRATARVEELQNALDLSLVEAANLTRHDGMAVRPLFGGRPEPVGSAHVFVLMPFADTFNPVYKTVRAAARQLRLSVERADDRISANAIMADIWSGICNCGVVVADCTGKNANVFYELGIAHVVGREAVLITQDVRDIPFDTAHLRHIPYLPTEIGLRKLQADLAKAISGIRSSGWTA